MTGSKSRRSPFNGPMRQADGVTVFASSLERTYVFTRNEMPLKKALEEICAKIDDLPGDVRIDCISTPTTIYRDLQGSREQRPTSLAKDRVKLFGASGEVQPVLVYPEWGLLGQIGRSELFRKPEGHLG